MIGLSGTVALMMSPGWQEFEHQLIGFIGNAIHEPLDTIAGRGGDDLRNIGIWRVNLQIAILSHGGLKAGNQFGDFHGRFTALPL